MANFMGALAGLAATLGLTCVQAQALVGPAQLDEAAAPHVVMLLKSDAKGASFCTANVIARDILVTAAHCVAQADDLRLYWPGANVADLPRVNAVAIHPDFRRDAPRTRERSIDLALVRTSAPLPSRFQPIAIDWSPKIAVGDRFTIAGFGLGRENVAASAGQLRSGRLEARAPLSSILLWAQDPAGKGLGACTGDSGGAIFSADGTRLVAVTVWATGEGKRQCGLLTQGVLLSPQRSFIETTLRQWAQK